MTDTSYPGLPWQASHLLAAAPAGTFVLLGVPSASTGSGYAFAAIPASVLIGSSVTAFNGRTGGVALSAADVAIALTFTPYSAANPSSYIGAADVPVQSVAGRTGAVVLAVADVSGAASSSSVPAAGSAAPVMDGVATVGTGAAFSRQDHIHPTDTSRYAAANPAGYQTATQVATTASRVNVNKGSVALTSAASVTTDASTGNNFTVTLGISATLANPINLAAGASYAWTIRQDATGGRLLTYGTAFKWQGGTVPTLSTAPNAVDLMTAISDGISLFAVVSKGFA